MNFDQIVAPIGKQVFMENFHRGACMLIKGDSDRFSNLISLQEIEQRLNDGCNTLSPVQIIGEGRRAQIIEKDLAWTPVATRKAEILKLLQSGHSFLMTNMSQVNAEIAALVDSLENGFPQDNVQADVHLYVSSHGDATGYDAHRDIPQHKLYLQVIGTTQWQVFESKVEMPADIRSISDNELDQNLTIAQEFELTPGDGFYMPPAVFHKVRNTDGPRVSVSIPFVNVVDSKIQKMDRTYIPFAEMFNNSQENNNNE